MKLSKVTFPANDEAKIKAVSLRQFYANLCKLTHSLRNKTVTKCMYWDGNIQSLCNLEHSKEVVVRALSMR